MNLSNLKIRNINRLISHTVHPKKKDEAAFSTHSDECLQFTAQEKGMLIGRLYDALGNGKKTFELNYDDKTSDSLYNYIHERDSSDESVFIEHTQELADKLASVHFRTNIPGGYCLFGEGDTFDGNKFFFVIKAELQEVFSINANILTLIQNVFLSPAKELHKIGFFIQNSSDDFIPFMYDDQFSMQKKDLTEYFYSGFMGLTTDRNDSIKSKNFYQEAKNFIDNNVGVVQDLVGLQGALNTLYREETSGIINAQEFADAYFEGRLKRKFEHEVVSGFPHSFTKDITLIDRTLSLARISIPLTYTTKIVGSISSMDDIQIVEGDEISDSLNDLPMINNRRLTKVVLISEAV